MGEDGIEPERTLSFAELPAGLRADVRSLWDYNSMGHDIRRVDAGIGLGSHDIGVATWAAGLFRRGVFPVLVFSGANAPTTTAVFPRGEAVHYREHAVALGVPQAAVLTETEARNTAENIDFSHALLRESGRRVDSVMLICRPYQQRRGYATCRKRWPDVDVICGSLPESMERYIERIGDTVGVIDMLVGDTQRVWRYAAEGWAIDQDVPDTVRSAFTRLVAAGFTSRLLPER
ncbi:YdcF family protein [Nocardia spumae]|uniref:YdcF family protein n=1 Tax=Nocardia spumae TaxID=2887190 RepID=UPI001D15BBAF|nr:YdcF family protein [Nocardia spumae]